MESYEKSDQISFTCEMDRHKLHVADCLSERVRSDRLSECLQSCCLDLVPTDEFVLCKMKKQKGGRILMVMMEIWTETTSWINGVPT